MKKILFAFVLVAGCNSSKAPTVPAAPLAAPIAVSGEVAAIPVGTKLKCPVAGEEFTVDAKTVQTTHNGKRYAFCCADCLPEFNKNPAKFAKN
jgi:YHS domain-containing protein